MYRSLVFPPEHMLSISIRLANVRHPLSNQRATHFNPGGKKHGLMNPEGPHAGDLPNITVGRMARGTQQVVNTHFTLGEGANSVFHSGGSAIVIHEKADDGKTDPAGDAGDRIACGVIEKAP